MALISQTRRLRRTPFSDGVEAAGVIGLYSLQSNAFAHSF